MFPIWHRDTAALAMEMIESGLKAIVTSVNPAVLPSCFAGRWFDRDLLSDLPTGIDPLGENGEFHTCVVDGPMLSSAIPAQPGRVVHRQVLTNRQQSPDSEATQVHPTYVYADVIQSP